MEVNEANFVRVLECCGFSERVMVGWNGKFLLFNIVILFLFCTIGGLLWDGGASKLVKLSLRVRARIKLY